MFKLLFYDFPYELCKNRNMIMNVYIFMRYLNSRTSMIKKPISSIYQMN